MGRILCLDAPTGIAGDMLAAVLVDLGAPLDQIKHYLARLGLPGWSIAYQAVCKNGLHAGLFTVNGVETAVNRHLEDILAMIGDADFPPRAAQVASHAFTCLAESEAAAHGCSVQQVHFHEVGAIDSIIDICAGALAIALLEVERVYIGNLPWSQGTVSCAHGLLTVPVPAVRHLLTGFQFESSSLPGELITPTGAAMLVAVAATQESPGKFRLLGVGGGGGHKDLAQPNILYGALGEPVEPAEPDGILLQDEVVVITTNMDDATGELLGMLWEQLPSEQILDISYGPLLMKKARPAWQLTIIAVPGSERKIAQLLFEQTSTNGVRIRREQRLKLPRRIMTTTTVYGDIEVKLAGNHIAPEYESVKAAAIQSGAAYQEVYLAAVAAVWEEQHERVDL